jgi:alkylated DNA nucleotide flippase Atl1
MAKTALEKLRKPQEAEIIQPLPESIAHWGPPGASMVISTPAVIDGIVRRIPRGRLATMTTLREALSRHHQTDIACPITTGIFLGIVARAADEMEQMGAKRVAPWWRVIKSDGSLNAKMPGGIAEHRKRLEAEGLRTVKKGKPGWAVVDYEAKLARLET